MARNKSSDTSRKKKKKIKKSNQQRYESLNDPGNQPRDKLSDESDYESSFDPRDRDEPFSKWLLVLGGLFLYFVFMRPSNKYDYDVFLSFRSDDVGDGLTGHLETALTHERINTFIELRKGEKPSGIIEAIRKSRVAVIIFSQDFASCTWCLEEVVTIIESHAFRKMLVPVFFRVNPSDVAHQNGTFAKAFASHEEGYKCKPHKVRRWRNALKEAANTAGWDFGVIRAEAQLVKYIVADIRKKIKRRSSRWEPELKMLVGAYRIIEKTFNALAHGFAGTLEALAEY